jgi:putative Mn2+ efflux pump MntP
MGPSVGRGLHGGYPVRAILERMSLPPVPPARPVNRLAVAALAVGIAAAVVGFVVGVFMLRMHPLLAVALPGVASLTAIVLGIVALVASRTRAGRGIAPAATAIVLGVVAFSAVFFGRVIGAELLGLTTWA